MKKVAVVLLLMFAFFGAFKAMAARIQISDSGMKASLYASGFGSGPISG